MAGLNSRGLGVVPARIESAMRGACLVGEGRARARPTRGKGAAVGGFSLAGFAWYRKIRMRLTRRAFVNLSLGSLGLSATAGASRLLLPQGVAMYTAKAQPKSAPSGRPFNAHFTDIAAAAGLTSPVIYGNPANNDYIIEATGCGCAFFDYDNDGWMEILLFVAARAAGRPTRRRDELAVQEQSRWHIC